MLTYKKEKFHNTIYIDVYFMTCFIKKRKGNDKINSNKWQ